MSLGLETKDIYLIGRCKEQFGVRKLPTKRYVLQVFFHKHSVLGLTIAKSVKLTVDELEGIWYRTRIPVCQSKHSITRLLKLHGKWKNLQKSRTRKRSITQKNKEDKFKEDSSLLFDIARHDAMEVLTEDQRQFLLSQRAQKRRGLVSTHPILPLVNKNHLNDANVHPKLEVLSQTLSGLSVTTTSSDVARDGDKLERVLSNFEDEIPLLPKKQKLNIMTPKLVAALDRTGTTPRKAMHILAAATEAFGFELDDVNLSHSTVYRARETGRKQMATQLKCKLRAAKILVLHWDGKLLPDNESSGKIERLPIIITGLDTEQLLGVPKLSSGTGENCANAMISAIDDWGVLDNVKALCFDTTSSNTDSVIFIKNPEWGRHKGACALLEHKLNREFLYLACRHHILEILLKSVVEVYWKVTSGPNMAIFERFKKEWDGIDKTTFKTGMEDELASKISAEQKDDLLEFISNQFEVFQPRNDYKEFLVLAYIFLGGIPPQGFSFKKPGANHHARWLAKAIYSLKIFLFKDQFFKKSEISRDVKALRQICIFSVLFYLKAWFTAPVAIYAPNHDLTLLQNLIKFQNVNAEVAKAASNKLRAHLWYLCPELAALGFFDSSVSCDVKQKMVQALTERKDEKERVTRITLTDGELKALQNLDISYFITHKSLDLFKNCNLPYDFLLERPDAWESNQSFRECRQMLKHLKVVNDVAERGVALAEEYNTLFTTDEEQYQYLVQVVAGHRKVYPNCDKKTFLNPVLDSEN